VYFRLTLFNGIVLLVAALTVAMAVMRARAKPHRIWFLAYYAVIIAVWRAFPGSFDLAWVAAGTTCALALRFEFLGGAPLLAVRTAEYFFFGYMIWRSAALLLLWPW